MSIHNFLTLPILSALLLQLILSPPISSFSLSPRRVWTPLRASGGEASNEDNAERPPPGPFEYFERAVRSVMRNDEYKFGDITRSVVDTTTNGIEDTVRAVTKDENYQFGDKQKKVIGSTGRGFEDVVHSMTGNEEYKFGDLSRGTLQAAGSAVTYSEKTLSALRDHNIHEMVEILNRYWNKSMNYAERKEAFTVFVYLGAILTLAYNFVANVMAGMVFAAAWTKISMATGASPLSPGNWDKFLKAKSTLDIFFDGPCLPARALITIPWFFRYRKFAVAAAYNSPLREKFPVINRYISLMLSWLVGNIAFVGGVTFLMVKMGSLLTGVPVFPAAS
eukprot:CAMPEP_0172311408 /NCGR_PEP_ID=MMETSP1058-20130122/14657_1 /TAXON_ID=83371 /ORGANISM="Detonula confervacea, Strain CCMP 353" /LENGTH=334 /DNA_ID=CAMNT_0013024573 /DNA_START=45 /DNA_END=1050 /DNA_ORIENTATION=+